MTAAEKRRAIIRPLAYRAEEAAVALGVSDEFFREQVAPEVRAVRIGRVKLYPVRELEGWLERNAALALEGHT
jgi:hypothetical protein